MGLIILPLGHRRTFALVAHLRAVRWPLLVNSAVIATYSYFGHKKFSFKK